MCERHSAGPMWRVRFTAEADFICRVLRMADCSKSADSPRNFPQQFRNKLFLILIPPFRHCSPIVAKIISLISSLGQNTLHMYLNTNTLAIK